MVKKEIIDNNIEKSILKQQLTKIIQENIKIKTETEITEEDLTTEDTPIDEEKCNKPHITELTGDLRTTDPQVLLDRVLDIHEKLGEKKIELLKLENEIHTEQRAINLANEKIKIDKDKIKEYEVEMETIEKLPENLVKEVTAKADKIIDDLFNVLGDEIFDVYTPLGDRNYKDRIKEIVLLQQLSRKGLIAGQETTTHILPLVNKLNDYIKNNPDTKIDVNRALKIQDDLMEFAHDYNCNNNPFMASIMPSSYNFGDEFTPGERNDVARIDRAMRNEGVYAHYTRMRQRLRNAIAEEEDRRYQVEIRQVENMKEAEDLKNVIKDLEEELERTQDKQNQ
jgi:hypothetical protein